MHPALSNGTYDVSKIREDFPILGMQVYGKPLVYLDNAASAQKPKVVLDRIQHAYTHEYANVHRGLHYLANAATEAYEGARDLVKGFLNAPRREEIIFTRNATEAINLVAYTFGRERIEAGDEIVLSIMEHHSNIVPWHFLRERKGAVIKWAPIAEDGSFLLDEFEKSHPQVWDLFLQVFDDGRLKTASFDATQGFGLRSVAGEAVGYGHASELSEGALQRAADAVRAVAR